jgi:Arc/MetJ family transcription regulator
MRLSKTPSLDFFACNVYDLKNSYTLKDSKMRTNIQIDDKLMDFVMATGDFKTKREAVEAGLQLIKRRKAYADIREARGTLLWDDSDEAWARSRAEAEAEAEAKALALAQTTAEGADQSMPGVAPETLDEAELAVHEPAAAYLVTKTPPAPNPATQPAVGKVSTRSGRQAMPGAGE